MDIQQFADMLREAIEQEQRPQTDFAAHPRHGEFMEALKTEEQAACASFKGDEDRTFVTYTSDKSAHAVYHQLFSEFSTASNFETMKLGLEIATSATAPEDRHPRKIYKITVELVDDLDKAHQ